MEEIDVESLVNILKIQVITAGTLANIFHTEICTSEYAADSDLTAISDEEARLPLPSFHPN